MRLLLDTNALLWALINAPRIEPVRDLLLADENEVFVSTVLLPRINLAKVMRHIFLNGAVLHGHR